MMCVVKDAAESHLQKKDTLRNSSLTTTRPSRKRFIFLNLSLSDGKVLNNSSKPFIDSSFEQEFRR